MPLLTSSDRLAVHIGVCPDTEDEQFALSSSPSSRFWQEENDEDDDRGERGGERRGRGERGGKHFGTE
eukprot:6274587-Pyramimonas_sp.AAC.1